jgi:hypothetical protein
MSRDINQCVPALRVTWEKGRREAEAAGIIIKPCDTSRTQTEQAVYFLNDKLPIDLVNDIRKSLGMKPETHRQLTKTLHSKHLITDAEPLSRAIDFYVEKDGKPDWDDIASYKKVGVIFTALGLRWLGSMGDYGHIEVR